MTESTCILCSTCLLRCTVQWRKQRPFKRGTAKRAPHYFHHSSGSVWGVLVVLQRTGHAGTRSRAAPCNVWRVICSSKHRTLINKCCTLKDRDSFTLLLNYLIILRQAFYMEKHYTDKISLQGTQLQIKPRKEGFQVKTGKVELYIFPNRSKCVVESPCEFNTRIFGFSSQCISWGMTY